MIWYWFFVITAFVAASTDTFDNKVFDYIIVGAGTTGGVIAARLTEDPQVQVLLIEAGDEPLPVSDIPYVAFKALKTNMDWNYLTKPQKNCCLAFKNQKGPISSGKALGGSSSLDSMIFVRGNRLDFDNWNKLGNDGWSYKDVLPYFLQMEDYQIISSKVDSLYHNEGGPVPVSIPTCKTPLADAFLQAGFELGYNHVDYNAANQTGFMYPPSTLKNGARCGTNCAYITPARSRPNFHLSINSLVTKILFDDNKTAVGVSFEAKYQTITVKAKREVIISCGAINSPKLLMLSGIGPVHTMAKFNIPSVAILPGVGQNLHDHVRLAGIVFNVNQSITTKFITFDNNPNLELWQKTKTGVMTIPVSTEGVSFYEVPNTEVLGWPDLEISMTTAVQSSDINAAFIYRPFQAGVPKPEANLVAFLPTLLRPKSRGEVTLQSTNPHDPPIIDPNYLSHPDDVKTLAQGFKQAMTIAQTNAFRRYGSRHITMGYFLQCFYYLLRPDDYHKCIAKTVSEPAYHLAGTCKMGPKSDPMAVVDPRLRVYGIKGLRVTDASIIPSLPSARPRASCIMIGEKAADMIKEDWMLHSVNLALNKPD